MNKARNLIADVLIGVVILVVLLWVVRGLLGFVGWLVNLVVIVLVIAGTVWVANRIRGE